MEISSELILVSADAGLEREVSKAIMESESSSIGSCSGFGELASRIGTDQAKIVLVDVGPDPMKTLAELEPFVTRFKEARFVILCSELGNEVVLEAMQIGARHCLVRASLATELPALLMRLKRTGPQVLAEGGLITVLSTRGGCGATTTAINLAEELQLKHESGVLLVDLDLDYGAAASYLGIEPRYGLGRVLAEGEMLDDQLIRSTATAVNAHLHVLASPASIPGEASESLDLSHIDRVLSGCRKAYSYTVVDAPRLSAHVTAQLARSSAVALVVFELSVIDLRRARQIINELQAQGVSREAIVPVAARYRKRGPMLRTVDAEQALPGFKVQTIRNDFDSVIRSVNLGVTLASSAPRSPARKDIRGLLEHLQPRLAPAA